MVITAACEATDAVDVRRITTPNEHAYFSSPGLLSRNEALRRTTGLERQRRSGSARGGGAMTSDYLEVASAGTNRPDEALR